MHSTTDVGPYAVFGKRTSRTPQPQAKFRGEAATLSVSLGFVRGTTRSSARDMWKTEVSRAIQ